MTSLTTTTNVCPLGTLNMKVTGGCVGSGLDPESPIQLVQMLFGSKLPR